MMRKEIRLMVGPPGTGKSTYVKKCVEEFMVNNDRTFQVASRDKIREKLTGSATGSKYFAKEKQVFKEFVNMANEAIKNKVEVIFLDATHLNPKSRNKILSRLEGIEDYVLVVETFRIPIDIALERNSHREGFAKVPEEAIKRMYKDFVVPTMTEFEEYKFASIHLVNFYE